MAGHPLQGAIADFSEEHFSEGGPTPAYYLSEPVVTDDAKEAGPLMMAVAELELAAAAAGSPAAAAAGG